MKKSKIITALIFAFVVLIGLSLFLAGNKKIALAPIDESIGKSLPPFENKDQIWGDKEDLVSFTISPNVKVHGILSYRGTIKGGYFFEGNILINILDSNKEILLKSNGIAKSDWMTAGPVDFEGNIDFTNLPKGPAYFEIKNDNPSDNRELDKSVLIPIIIE